MTATDLAVATGMIDEQRIGVTGRGYGGFVVQAVVTQTNRFKAAAVTSGVANWSAAYLSDTDPPSSYEHGHGRFEKPLWDDPVRYMENSPLSYWNRVKTPLLLVDSEQGGTAQRTAESYKGIQRINGTGIYAYYIRGLTVEATRRVQGWFNEHLLGGPRITQFADQGSFLLGED